MPKEPPAPVPDVDEAEDVGAAAVRPEDGKDPYPADAAVYQDRPNDGGEI